MKALMMTVRKNKIIASITIQEINVKKKINMIILIQVMIIADFFSKGTLLTISTEIHQQRKHNKDQKIFLNINKTLNLTQRNMYHQTSKKKINIT